ncbi:MAG: hypothetical protein AB1635_10775 [Acidobacteriota bacterium]
MRSVTPCTRAAIVAAVVAIASSLPAELRAQESQSAPLAAELVKLLEEKKLDAIAARHPGGPGAFTAALYFPGQLLVAWANYEAPRILNEKLIRREYRDIYIDLNSASIPESRVLITDMGADGVKTGRAAGDALDIHDAAGKVIRFDGNWREDRMSEKEYMQRFAEVDKAYAEALRALIEELKKPS